MHGSEVFVYNWQIKKETKKSFLVFLALGQKHKSKKIKVWLPKKLCHGVIDYREVFIPDDFEFSIINSKREKERISGEELIDLIRSSRCKYGGYSNVPEKKEAVRIEAIDELKR
jgi:hypothetical protein